MVSCKEMRSNTSGMRALLSNSPPTDSSVEAPAATPRRSESGGPHPRSMATSSPARNASPAPTALPLLRGGGVASQHLPAAASTAPSRPRVTATLGVPARCRVRAARAALAALETGMEQSRAASCSFGTRRSHPAWAASRNGSPSQSTTTLDPADRAAAISGR